MKTFNKSVGFAKKPFRSRATFGGNRGFSRDDAPTERFQATCNECHELCEVPFKPNGKKPVYCRNCYKGKEEGSTYGNRDGGARREYGAPAPASDPFAALGAKIDRLTDAIEAHTRALGAPRK